MNDAESRLRSLLDIALSGSQTDDQSDELRRLLDDSPELRPAAIEQLRTHSLLLWELSPTSITKTNSITKTRDSVPHSEAPPSEAASPQRVDDASTGGVRPPQTGASADPSVAPRPRGLGKPLGWTTLLAVAAGLALVAWTSYPLGPSPNPIGTIVCSDDIRLTTATTDQLLAGRLVPGVLEVAAGSVAIEFASGVEMDVAGPARFEVVSGMLVRLEHGQATAQVPRWARGFTIETPDVGVVDLGTRFGVARETNGKTDVVVFEGEVDLKSLASKSNPFERRLTQGEAARVDSLGGMERIFQVHGDWTRNQWSTYGRAESQDLITAVWDNLGATKSVSYYQVLSGGMEEDAPAYVDHPHEWNGLDTTGLPAFLKGAEYVRTVNDYRYSAELAIQIEFADDADLYILFDNRVALPDWLQENYEDTGADIGLDEDAWHGNPEFSVSTGAGKSIDNSFSVWRRPCRRGEVVVLGSVGVGREARAMYGVAAVRRQAL